MTKLKNFCKKIRLVRRAKKMIPPGLDPGTSSVLRMRHNQLDYGTCWWILLYNIRSSLIKHLCSFLIKSVIFIHQPAASHFATMEASGTFFCICHMCIEPSHVTPSGFFEPSRPFDQLRSHSSITPIWKLVFYTTNIYGLSVVELTVHSLYHNLWL